MTNLDLIQIAKNARKNAVCDNTGYAVGAALITEEGTVYIGANIEEPAIIGLSNCAERVAIQNALSHGERNFKAIAVVGGNRDSESLDTTLTPCGACAQYILDMCPNVDIIMYMDGKLVEMKPVDLLRAPFILGEKNGR